MTDDTDDAADDDDKTQAAPIKDYEITIRVRNNYLLSAIREAGYKNIADFARRCNLSISGIQEYATLKRAPLIVESNGLERWSNTIINIADALGTVPENLFPVQHIRKCIPKNSARVEASIADVEFLIEQRDFSTQKLIAQHELKEKIDEAIETLAPRQKKIIRERFFEGKLLEECGRTAGIHGQPVTREVVRQIEAKALRLLHHPSRSRKLREFLTSPDYLEDTESALLEKNAKQLSTKGGAP